MRSSALITRGLYGLGRGATLLVAASNASAKQRAQADFLCDGTSDEAQITAAIAALPASGGTILLSEGTFNIVTGIALGNYVTLRGQGYGTLLQQTITPAAETNIISATTKSGILIVSLRVKGANTTNFGDGITFTTVSDSEIRNVWVQTTKEENIALYACTNVRVIGCHLDTTYDANAANITMDTANGIVVSGCIMEASKGYGVSMGAAVSANNCIIIGNIIKTSDYAGIHCSSQFNTIVGNNISDVVSRDGIYLAGAYNVCTANTITNPARHGIYADVSTYCTIDSNMIDNPGTHGIFAAGVAYSSICSNVIRNPNAHGTANTADGIYLDNSNINSISNNVIKDSANRMRYGVNEDVDSDLNRITGNYTSNGSTANMLISGTHSIVKDNSGYTESGDVVRIIKAIDHASLTDVGDATAYMDFADAIPAGSIIKAVKCDFTEAFNSDDTTTLTMMIGYVGDLDALSAVAPGVNAFNHTTDVYWGESGCTVPVVTTAITPRVTFTEDNDGTDIINSVNAQGAVTITITYMKA